MPAEAFGRELPDAGLDPADTVELLASAAETGLMAMACGRFHGCVIGGTRWHDRAVLRISVANWSSDDQDVEVSLSAVHEALEATQGL
jgi:hypothetical protein